MFQFKLVTFPVLHVLAYKLYFTLQSFDDLMQITYRMTYVSTRFTIGINTVTDVLLFIHLQM